MALTKNSQIDLNGNEMILDADADTSITADTDDQIDIKVGGTDTVVITGGAIALKGATPTLTIGDAGAEDTKIVFDGNAQDFYIGLDDSADDLIIGKGSTVGTTAALVIDEDLNVGIANTSPVSKLDVTHTITSNTGDSIASFGTSGSGGWANSAHQVIVGGPSLSSYTGLIISSDSTSGYGQLSFADGKGANDSWRGHIVYHHATDYLAFATDAAERMRINSDGRLLLNKTDSQSTPARFDVTRSSGEHAINTFVNTTGNSSIIAFWNTNGIVGTINTSGSATSYNTSSDARLKNVLGEAKGLEIINALNPVNFEWKSDGKIQDGLIAQEVEEVFPQAVSEPELDEEWYSVDYSRFVTPLIKAIQEQQEQIEALQSEINTLKGG